MRINIPMTNEIEAYLDEVAFREHPVLAQCRAEAATRGIMAMMQMAPEQGALLGLLIELVNARRVLEIGTFTGYSALAMALALPAGGQLVTCEQDAELIGLARGFWKDAGVADLIDARIGDAAATLEAMLEEEGPGLFDMVLIDADKPSYPRYLELAAELVRVGGLIVVDDTLIHGRVATGPLANDPDHVGAAVEAMRVVNDRLRHDERFTSVLLPLRDGLTLARRCS